MHMAETARKMREAKSAAAPIAIIVAVSGWKCLSLNFSQNELSNDIFKIQKMVLIKRFNNSKILTLLKFNSNKYIGWSVKNDISEYKANEMPSTMFT